MNEGKNIHFAKYHEIVQVIERKTVILEKSHQKHMQCKNGCDMCCIDFSIFPVEYYSILNDLKSKNINPEPQQSQNNDTCVFLKNHSCTIYQHRPVMCRTHGFPLLYANDDGDYELSVCELNFTDFEFEKFTMKNTLPQDKFNSMLFVLNRQFIADFQHKKYNETDLIPLRQLALEFTKTKNKE